MIKEEKCYWASGKIRVHRFFKDGMVHGEYKWWWEDGELETHRFYKDGMVHGEYKWWNRDGLLTRHDFFKDNVNITDDIVALVHDIKNITNEERMIIKLTHGINCL